MTYERTGVVPGTNSQAQADSMPPGFTVIDLIRFYYQRRCRLVARLLITISAALIVTLFMYFRSPRRVEGTLALRFDGIGQGKYPSGSLFSVEDFRSAPLLSQAIADSGIDSKQLGVGYLAAHLLVAPMIPAEVQNRWKIQDKEGIKREEFFPSEFKIMIEVQELSDNQRVRLFDAIVFRYRNRLKHDQKAALSLMASLPVQFEALSATHDYWDIPGLFDKVSRSLDSHVNSIVTESSRSDNPRWQLSFKALARRLELWQRARLEALEALTYQQGIARNKDLLMQRIRYQLDNVDIQIIRKKQETIEAMHLLDVTARPGAILAGQLGNREGLPLIDAGVLDRLVRSDYIRPVVERISVLQSETQALEAEKARLIQQHSWLSKSKSAGLPQAPPHYRQLVELLSTELNGIIQEYNGLLDEYLVDTVTSQIVVTRPPTVSRGGTALVVMVAGAVLVGAFLAVSLLPIEHALSRARETGP